jgi:hypothetical protein
MTLSKGLVRLGAVLGLFAFVLGLSAAFAGTTQAQSPPATFYGTASADDVVDALIDDVSCGTATADSDGFWMMQITEDAACEPSDGDTVSFTLNGAATNETETWKPGGAPADAAVGVTLTLAAAAAPGAPETGNAGLLAAEQGSSPWLALSLGVLALAMVAGARAATGWQKGRVR